VKKKGALTGLFFYIKTGCSNHVTLIQSAIQNIQFVANTICIGHDIVDIELNLDFSTHSQFSKIRLHKGNARVVADG